MAIEEVCLSGLRAAIEVGQGGDLIRQLAAWALQQLIEAGARRKCSVPAATNAARTASWNATCIGHGSRRRRPTSWT